jgi:hypothetical protein
MTYDSGLCEILDERGLVSRLRPRGVECASELPPSILEARSYESIETFDTTLAAIGGDQVRSAQE